MTGSKTRTSTKRVVDRHLAGSDWDLLGLVHPGLAPVRNIVPLGKSRFRVVTQMPDATLAGEGGDALLNVSQKLLLTLEFLFSRGFIASRLEPGAVRLTEEGDPVIDPLACRTRRSSEPPPYAAILMDLLGELAPPDLPFLSTFRGLFAALHRIREETTGISRGFTAAGFEPPPLAQDLLGHGASIRSFAIDINPGEDWLFPALHRNVLARGHLASLLSFQDQSDLDAPSPNLIGTPLDNDLVPAAGDTRPNVILVSHASLLTERQASQLHALMRSGGVRLILGKQPGTSLPKVLTELPVAPPRIDAPRGSFVFAATSPAGRRRASLLPAILETGLRTTFYDEFLPTTTTRFVEEGEMEPFLKEAASTDPIVALDISICGAKPAERSVLLGEQGRLLLGANRPMEAIQALRDALHQGSTDPAIFLNLARSYAGTERLKKALETIDRESGLGGESLPEAEALRGEILWKMGNPAPAERACRTALSADSHPGMKARLLSLLASLEAEAGRAEEAGRLLDEAYELADLTQKSLGLILRRHGRILALTGRQAEALARLRKAEAAYRAAGDSESAAGCLVDVGNRLRHMGRPEEALTCYDEASKQAQKATGVKAAKLARFNQACLLAERGEWRRSLDLFNRQRILDETSGHLSYLCMDRCWIGIVHCYQGERQTGKSLLSESEDTFQALGESENAGHAALALAVAHLDCGEWMPCRKALRRARNAAPASSSRADAVDLLLAERRGEGIDAALLASLRKRYEMGSADPEDAALAAAALAVNAADRSEGAKILSNALLGQEEIAHLAALSRLAVMLVERFPDAARQPDAANRIARIVEALRREAPSHPDLEKLCKDSPSAPREDRHAAAVLSIVESVSNAHRPEEMRRRLLRELAARSGATQGLVAIVEGDRVKPITSLGFDEVPKSFGRSIEAHQTQAKQAEIGRPKRYGQRPSARTASIKDLAILKEAMRGCRTAFRSDDTKIQVIALPIVRHGIPEGVIALQAGETEAGLRSETEALLERLVPALPSSLLLGPERGSTPAGETTLLPGLIGRSRAMTAACKRARNAALTEVPVLLQGESGCGKELFARAIHDLSPRNQGPFVPVNTGALPDTLAAACLQGARRGAYSGADTDRPGLAEEADGGTLLLDEVGDMTPAAQLILLRLLQEKEVLRIGENRPRKVDVRFIFATHKDLEKGVEEGWFRKDLFYRINVYSLRIPPLRDRLEDIPMLVRSLLSRLAERYGLAVPAVEAKAMAILASYPYPGNVRELENILTRTLVDLKGETIGPAALPKELAGTGRSHEPTTLKAAVAGFEYGYIADVLERCNNNKSQAARLLGLSRQGLIGKLKALGLRLP